MGTTATADVLAGSKPIKARSALNERADAYIPWSSAVSGAVMDAVRALVKKNVPLANAASMVLNSGEKLSISSELSWMDGMYTYRLAFKNEGPSPLQVAVAGVRLSYQIVLYLQPGEDAAYELPSAEPPEEREALVKVENACEFPIRVLMAESMTEPLAMEEAVPSRPQTS
jgi:hypothetical protein